MAARTRKIWHDETIRQKIKVGLLVKRLQDHTHGIVEMSQTQVRAAEILLRKAIPDLAAIEHSGDVQQSYVVRMPAAVADLGAWRDQQEAKPVEAIDNKPANPLH